ncbi:hypothetical protein TK50_26875 [Micromonospora haikouensis]|uniref:Golgi phosphoprotein 3 (GPP34) n=2 Tax=Micromonosporaceae TaxID=28056 RepID=A0A0D0UR48_9ACTN|nr:hypothetical protein TK50_26875 [Micromonospora haikouensis]
MTTIPRLPLRDELFMLAHDDDTGRLHVHRRALALGLAGAVLIDLHLAARVIVDPPDPTSPVPGQRLRLRTDRPVGDLIADAALASLHPTRTAPPLRTWLRHFAVDLYDRTRAGLVTTGILRPHRQRRLAGIAHRDTYLPTHCKWSVVPRARLCYLAQGREQPNDHTAALAGLVAVLGLTTHLYLDNDPTTLTTRLTTIADQHHRAVRDITAAVDASIGDLATATYR